MSRAPPSTYEATDYFDYADGSPAKTPDTAKPLLSFAEYKKKFMEGGFQQRLDPDPPHRDQYPRN